MPLDDPRIFGTEQKAARGDQSLVDFEVEERAHKGPVTGGALSDLGDQAPIAATLRSPEEVRGFLRTKVLCVTRKKKSAIPEIIMAPFPATMLIPEAQQQASEARIRLMAKNLTKEHLEGAARDIGRQTEDQAHEGHPCISGVQVTWRQRGRTFYCRFR